jgi:hypothetical protein
VSELTSVPLSRPIRPSEVRARSHVRIVADEAERQALAAALGLEGVEFLEADFGVRPWRKRGIRVEGRVRARIGQLCAVTFEPLAADIDEAVDERLMPAEAMQRRREEVIDVEATDDFETYEGDTVDLGALAFEYLVMGIDPYPRHADAEIGTGLAPENQPAEARSPFAVLKGRGSGGGTDGGAGP